jgi:PPE-repeat protein
MYGYAGASAAATRVTPFTEPPQTTSPSGTTMQAASVDQAAGSATGSSTQSALSSVPNLLQNISVGSIVSPSNLDPGLGNLFTAGGGSGLNTFTENVGNWALVVSGPLFTASGITPLLGGLYGLAMPTAAAVAGDVNPLDAGLGTLVNSPGPAAGGLGNGVSASLGESATVGKLSVPQSWAESPAIRLAGSASPLSAAGLGGVPQAEAVGPGGFFGIPPVGSLVNAPRGEQSRARSDSDEKVVSTMPGEAGGKGQTPAPAPQPQKIRKHVASALSEREREELDKLRKEIAEVATERDAAARLIKEAML